MAKRESKDKETYPIVVARDTDYDGVARCIVCGDAAHHVHEILPRSYYGRKNREELFAVENRCCLCRDCHGAVQSDPGRGMLLHIMTERYNYTYKGKALCLLEEYVMEEGQ